MQGDFLQLGPDGSRFRLTEARGMGECRGSINWLTVWRAKAVPR